LRVEELATLKVHDVDLEAGVLRVAGKGDKERELPIVPRLAGILRDDLATTRPALLACPLGRGVEALPEGPYLFVNAGTRGPWRVRRAGDPLLTRTMFHVVRDKSRSKRMTVRLLVRRSASGKVVWRRLSSPVRRRCPGGLC
jgi:integrase